MSVSGLPPRHILSKSTFMRGCQCAKSLWLHKHHSAMRDALSETQASIFAQGTNVGLLARELYPNGVDASPADAFHYQQSVADTQRYLAEGRTVIYEAAFQFEGVLAAVDILVMRRGRWYAYEVKSSTSVKEQYVTDAALQYYVIRNAGIELRDIFIVHINSDYVRRGNLSVSELFYKESVLNRVLDLQAFISGQVRALKKVAQLVEAPDVASGAQCHKPYTCDFFGYCHATDEAEDDFGAANIDAAALAGFVSTLQYPLYFMDFETWSAAVPEYDGHWAYRQVPFQFSVHRQDAPGAPLQHDCFLADASGDTCSTFLEALLPVMGEEGSVVVYNKAFENRILNELKEDHPFSVERIENIQQRMVDLMQPFRRKQLYLPEMQRSYSIKYVLPALVPGLSYDTLAIGNGGDASAAFYELRTVADAAEVARIRKALLEYCALDTLAMYRILQKIQEHL
ncbi:MAG: DUF2779 domain-containing protein [Chitinophagaceae bacterium]|nr:MAG: DUF2779 domain-containing protein [Chitinophagaceae bacterium]